VHIYTNGLVKFAPRVRGQVASIPPLHLCHVAGVPVAHHTHGSTDALGPNFHPETGFIPSVHLHQTRTMRPAPFLAFVRRVHAVRFNLLPDH
jgi:hypothetical protein